MTMCAISRKQRLVLQEALASYRLGHHAYCPTRMGLRSAKVLVRLGLVRWTTRHTFRAIAITESGRAQLFRINPRPSGELCVIDGGRR